MKAGTISINAAAAVSSLPAEEQKAAVVAGKDELKQAAKRVRDAAKRKPREPSADDAAPSDAENDADEVQALRRRVAELEAENASLRRQVADLVAG